ncbi:MAG: hypothetical protein U0821_16880 [Chloroflexota bacterium]
MSEKLHVRATVSTVTGTGVAGRGAGQINNPFGVILGPDGDLWFCDLDNRQVRRQDRGSGAISTVAGTGDLGHTGDGGPALAATLNTPHEICFNEAGDLFIVERDNHAVRRVDARTGTISTYAGTGEAGFSGDGGPADRARLRQPHSIAIDGRGDLLICDIGNHRVRRVDRVTGLISTFAGNGEPGPTPDEAPVAGTPLNGPRTIVFGPDGTMYLALREGNAIYAIDPSGSRLRRIAGTGAKGHTGDGGPALNATLAGPKGLAYGPEGCLYIADTENHVIRSVDLASGVITTVLGTGQRGDGPESSPLVCALARPHGLFAPAPGELLVADSENHRIRLLRRG